MSTVYHYTTAVGIQGILGKRELWLTESSFMNDPGETSYSRSIVLSSLDKVVKELGFQRDDVIRDLKDFIAGASLNEFTFIFSCSRDADSLPLWHMYGTSEGYALEIEAAQSMALFNNAFTDYPLCRFLGASGLIYERGLQEAHSEAVIREYLTNLAQGRWQFNSREALLHKLNEILPCMFWFKHQCYEQEKEFRFIFQIDHVEDDRGNEAFTKNVEFRIGNGILIPYLRIRLPDLDFIKKIRVSPLNGSDIAIKGIQQFLTKVGTGIRVELSNLPYRTI